MDGCGDAGGGIVSEAAAAADDGGVGVVDEAVPPPFSSNFWKYFSLKKILCNKCLNVWPSAPSEQSKILDKTKTFNLYYFFSKKLTFFLQNFTHLLLFLSFFIFDKQFLFQTVGRRRAMRDGGRHRRSKRRYGWRRLMRVVAVAGDQKALAATDERRQ